MELLGNLDPPATAPSRTTTLVGEHVRLVPVEPARHADAVQRWVGADDHGFDLVLGSPIDHDGSAERYLEWVASFPDNVPFAVELMGSGELVGLTRYLHVEPARRVLHVGGTWYAPPARGSVVNPEAKLLLLDHAFGLGFNRVQIQTDVTNERSQRAIAGIGATFEGVSRADYPRRDGTVRSTWVAAVIRADWPAVRERLARRVAGASPPAPLH